MLREVSVPTLLQSGLRSGQGAGAACRGLDVAARMAPRASDAVATEFAVVSDRASFDALEAEWSDLFARAGRPEQAFQSFNWLWHWANHYLSRRGATLAVVTARRNGRLVLIWPLVRERHAGLVTLAWMGAPVSQYGDVLIDHVEDAADLVVASWRYVSAALAPDLVVLRKVRADAAIAPFLAGLGATVTDRQQAPYLDLASAPDFAAYEARYPAKARKNRRRQQRRLEERGAAGFETHAGGAPARDLALRALELKRAWLSERGLVSPALSDERMSRFIADVADGASHPTGCRVSALKSAGEPAAIEIAFACNGRLLVHVIVYALKFAKTGAGNLLVEECVRQAKRERFERFDLLAPGDAYKMEWADGAVAVDDVAIALTRAGRYYRAIYLDIIRGRLKAAVGMLPTGVRRVVTAGYAAFAGII